MIFTKEKGGKEAGTKGDRIATNNNRLGLATERSDVPAAAL